MIRVLGVVLGAGLALSFSNAADAQSLAGQHGDKRYPIHFPRGPKDACAKAYAQYVAANRHAAYAQSIIGSFDTEAFFCSIAAAATTEAAEKKAVDQCNSLGKKYKMKTSGRCRVYASK